MSVSIQQLTCRQVYRKVGWYGRSERPTIYIHDIIRFRETEIIITRKL